MKAIISSLKGVCTSLERQGLKRHALKVDAVLIRLAMPPRLQLSDETKAELVTQLEAFNLAYNNASEAMAKVPRLRKWATGEEGGSGQDLLPVLDQLGHLPDVAIVTDEILTALLEDVDKYGRLSVGVEAGKGLKRFKREINILEQGTEELREQIITLEGNAQDGNINRNEVGQMLASATAQWVDLNNISKLVKNLSEGYVK